MIHYVTVGVALSRPPAVHEYRRYAIYGATHTDAELVALQMASCTSVMPVEVVAYRCGPEVGCKLAETEPHGVIGCRCWPAGGDVHPEDGWLIDEHCPYHGNIECPPGVHSMFDPCPGNCACTCPLVDVTSIDTECPLHGGTAPAGADRQPTGAADTASAPDTAPETGACCGGTCGTCQTYCEVYEEPDTRCVPGVDCGGMYDACATGGVPQGEQQLKRERGVFAAVKRLGRRIRRWIEGGPYYRD